MNLAESNIPDKSVETKFLNNEDLVRYAGELGRLDQQSTITKKRRSLLTLVGVNNKVLHKAYQSVISYLREQQDLVPASEWLLDNFYLLKNLKQEIRQQLPVQYERKLPCLLSDRHQGYPRVYTLMRELVEHTDSRIQENILREYISGYQQIVPLSSGELWAVPMMLKILLLDKICYLAEEILATQKERITAGEWLKPFEHLDPGEWEKVLASRPRPLNLTPTFVERVSKKVKEYGRDGLPILRWLERAVQKQALTIETMTKLEHQRQSNYQVAMGNAISGFRFLIEVDWPRLFEEINVVHQVLLLDPSGIFAVQDFDSRDYYRHHVEKLAQKLHVSELVIARKVVELSKQDCQANQSGHIGYYLLGEGQRELMNAVRADQGLKTPKKYVGNHSWIYFGIITLGSALGELFWITYALNQNASISILILIVALTLIPISSLVIGISNWLTTLFKQPAFLPKLELRDGIPVEFKTVVVIPSLYSSTGKIKELTESLEVYYLANQDPNLFFAILGDYADASQENEPEDESLIAYAREEIRRLNNRYGQSRFFFLHRSRIWNEAERVWMGWERKRGKLLEFNRFVLEGFPGGYTTVEGNMQELSGIKYVITLDSDTRLPRDSAKRLIGTMAHPLQSPVLNLNKTRVISGYGILQPRIGISILSSGATLFARIFAGKVGIDPYTTAISDVYQDLFGEGIFTGKGIYDIQVFHQVTANTFPENQILSHDLIEGLYVRAGLVTDIQFVDGFPAKYQAYLRRLHRWVRGDWQLLPWLRQPLPGLAKWKIIDNLRRSLEAPLQISLLFLSIVILPGNPWVWYSIVLIGIFLPVFLHLVENVWKWKEQNKEMWIELRQGMAKALCNLTFLPFQAFVMLDAIIRSLYRQWITRRHLLEWETAENTERRLNNTRAASWRTMGPTVLLIWLMVFILYWFYPGRSAVILPFAALWTMAPWVSYRISSPLRESKEQLDSGMEAELRLFARRIWAFFEDHVTERENWLPPDNIQIDPPKDVAHRTSPTNIGLALLGNLAAWDLGYLTDRQAVERIDNSLRTIERLERWQGHLYNWYDTLTLVPLQPLYISTVDSGNLAVYLLTLSEGLNDISKSLGITSDAANTTTVNNGYIAVAGPRLAQGLQDTYKLLLNDTQVEELETLKAFAQNLEQLLMISPFNPEKQAKRSFDSMETAEAVTKVWDQLFEVWPKVLPELKREGRYWLERLERMLQLIKEDFAQTSLHGIHNLAERILDIQGRLERMSLAMDFKPLYDGNRQLFSIGYRTSEGAQDRSYYDLLASEARQAGFFAIAKGDIPQAHWFRLGRGLTNNHRKWSLVSWSGTMFEFLMPLLIMRSYEGTILDETCRSVVKVQHAYGKNKNIPWGISESGYYAFDPQMNYQYKAFGVPSLGLKRGLGDELVVAPYASFLALQVYPIVTLENIQRMCLLGYLGRYGLYEAADYTSSRLQAGQEYRLVKSFMAHHQGMSLLAITNVLHQQCFQDRFHAHPLIQATELLLQERVPSKTTIAQPPEEQGVSGNKQENHENDEQRMITRTKPVTPVPVTHFIGNGSYTVMAANSGAGFSRYKNMMITRWHADATRENWGLYFYIQNLNAGNTWSAAYQPLAYAGRDYQMTVAPDKIEYQRQDGNIHTRTTVVVSPEEPVEIRRISLSNYSQYSRTIEITSYFEVVLAPLADDLAHPAFSNLFIQTEFTRNALIATRRTRTPEQKQYWLMHAVNVEGTLAGTLQYETDRARFIGRGRSLERPLALEPNQPLSNTVGAVLDPIMSLRQRVLIKPGQTVHVSFAVGVAETKEAAVYLAGKYQEYAAVQRAMELAWTCSQMELRHLGLSPLLANTASSLGGQILYPGPSRRRQSVNIIHNTKGQTGLWSYGISGDHPIILLCAAHVDHLGLVRQLLKIHEYWQSKGLIADLVILNEDESGYLQSFQETLQDMVGMGYGLVKESGAGKIIILKKKNIPEAELTLLYTVAMLIFEGEAGSFFAQARKLNVDAGLTTEYPSQEKDESQTEDQNWLPSKDQNMDQYEAQNQDQDVVQNQNEDKRTNKHPSRHTNQQDFHPEGNDAKTSESKADQEPLIFRNYLGGFTLDGKEYVINLEGDSHTPLPWINVIANSRFGFQISASGAGYTWSGNSRENKLTTWSNDPVLDPLSEVMYLQDDLSQELWSVTPEPIRGDQNYRIRHGQGYTVFEQASHNLEQQLTVFVPLQASVKIGWLKLKNNSENARKLSVSYYAELVMGTHREVTAPYIFTDFDPQTQSLNAHNVYQEEFAGHVTYLKTVGGETGSYTGDRTEFIGRNRSLSQPEGLNQEKLSNTSGAGYDPCLALKTPITLEAGATRNIFVILGESATDKDRSEQLEKYSDPGRIESALREVKDYWQELLGSFQVETPAPSFDLLVNGWLLYQTVVCRLWARSAFYQSGGAFGFRDQLQDAMALVLVKPQWTREQILRHCAQQFKEGDVQHWWHQEGNKGIRTKFSDDLLWLPYVTLDYIEHTGDYSILEEEVTFLEDALLGEEEDERYAQPSVAAEQGSVHEHCLRAIDRGLRLGKHGLPLIGTGDWNDGFSRVGRLGQGESVWLGWFLICILERYAVICQHQGDSEQQERYLQASTELRKNMDIAGWDGGWYRRAYYDDGSMIGSAENKEGQIDAIAQVWAVIAGATREARVQDAMLALENYLWRKEERLLLLLTPPFDQAEPNPGYIRGYVPGVRENGGQYTHAAAWTVFAFTGIGQGQKALELFQMLNPIHHTQTESEVRRYKVEPYVMAADVYANAQHTGRGGWTWYTGAAGWMYQAAVEGILGFHLSGDKLTLSPCLTPGWPGYKITYRYKSAIYRIQVENPKGKMTGMQELYLDGQLQSGESILLQDDGLEHCIRAVM